MSAFKEIIVNKDPACYSWKTIAHIFLKCPMFDFGANYSLNIWNAEAAYTCV